MNVFWVKDEWNLEISQFVNTFYIQFFNHLKILKLFINLNTEIKFK